MVGHGKSWKIIIINHCSCQSKDKVKQIGSLADRGR